MHVVQAIERLKNQDIKSLLTTAKESHETVIKAFAALEKEPDGDFQASLVEVSYGSLAYAVVFLSPAPLS